MGYLFNETALALFKQFELGEFREYKVTVRDRKGVAQTLTYLSSRLKDAIESSGITGLAILPNKRLFAGR